MIMRLYLVAFFLTISASLFAQNLPEPFVLDGTISVAELRSKDAFPIVEEDDWVTIREKDNLVYIAVTSNQLTIISAFLVGFEQLKVLHASAALGEANYNRQGETWQPDRERFDWIYRDPLFWGDEKHPDGVDSPAAFFQKYGWTANTVGMGSAREMELVFDKTRVGPYARVVVSYTRKDGESGELVLGPGEQILTGDSARDLSIHNGELKKDLTMPQTN
jgi:hypothetical protein